jgi:hypothetical protein
MASTYPGLHYEMTGEEIIKLAKDNSKLIPVKDDEDVEGKLASARADLKTAQKLYDENPSSDVRLIQLKDATYRFHYLLARKPVTPKGGGGRRRHTKRAKRIRKSRKSRNSRNSRRRS